MNNIVVVVIDGVRAKNLSLYGYNKETDKNLKKLASELKLGERVKFVSEVLPEEIPARLAAADIFVRPSLSEGLGNSFLEAMAVGLPVVGTPVGGIPDFLEDGKTGWFCRPNDSASIVEKVKYIADPANQTVVQVVTQNARQMVAEKYDWDKIASKMKIIFEGL